MNWGVKVCEIGVVIVRLRHALEIKLSFLPAMLESGLGCTFSTYHRKLCACPVFQCCRLDGIQFWMLGWGIQSKARSSFSKDKLLAGTKKYGFTPKLFASAWGMPGASQSSPIGHRYFKNNWACMVSGPGGRAAFIPALFLLYNSLVPIQAQSYGWYGNGPEQHTQLQYMLILKSIEAQEILHFFLHNIW